MAILSYILFGIAAIIITDILIDFQQRSAHEKREQEIIQSILRRD